jgi:hypothetical protein
MAILKMKTCTLSGKRFRATSKNFYASPTSSDGYHPYQKNFDNFRRVTGTSVQTTRKLINLLK